MLANNDKATMTQGNHDSQFRNHVLEMLVNGAPLTSILETLLLDLEALKPGAVCSLGLLDAEGKHFVRTIGPSLPDFYIAALAGLAIGPGAGSCGSAAFSGALVVVDDIASHPFWRDYKPLAERAGLAACWSHPIQSAAGKVLGTFAIYYRQQRAPDASDLELIQQSAALACIAIEKDTEAQKLRDSEMRYRTLVEWSPDAVLVHRAGNILYVNPSAVRVFGGDAASSLVGRQTWELIHPDFREEQAQRMQAINSQQAIKPMVESRFLRMDGTPFDVEVQGTAIVFEGLPAIQVVMRDITQRKLTERALQESEERFRALVEFLPTGIILHQNMRVVYANPAALRILAAASESDLLGRSVQDLTHADDWQGALQRMRQREETGQDPLLPTELKLIRCDGVVIDVQMSATLIRYGGSSAVQASFTDITERRSAKQKLQLAAKVFSHAREGIVITDANTLVVDANATFSTISGYSLAELLGTQPSVFREGPHSADYFGALWDGLREHGSWSGEVWSQRKSGERCAEMVTISAVRDEAGQTKNYVLLFVDISPMKTYQQQLENMAHFDGLTQLPNRLLLADRLQHAMIQALRRKEVLAVVFLDLDGFKAVNDRYGHAVGDELLIVLSQRMKGALRESDTLARVGGDEFVAVLVDLNQPEDAEPVLERLLLAAADGVQLGNAELQVSASMGIAIFPRDGAHTDLLLRRADQSMYLAKQAGRNRFRFFSQDDRRSGPVPLC